MRVVTEKRRKASQEAGRKNSSNPEFSAAVSKKLTELWANPEFREKHAKNLWRIQQPDDAVKLPPEALDL